MLVHVCGRNGLDTGVAKSDPCVYTQWIWQSAHRQAGAKYNIYIYTVYIYIMLYMFAILWYMSMYALRGVIPYRSYFPSWSGSGRPNFDLLYLPAAHMLVCQETQSRAVEAVGTRSFRRLWVLIPFGFV